MGTEHTVLILIGMLLLAIAMQPLARRIHLPFTATLVIAGLAPPSCSSAPVLIPVSVPQGFMT